MSHDKPVAARGLVNGWMALAPDGMERSGRFVGQRPPDFGLLLCREDTVAAAGAKGNAEGDGKGGDAKE